jgi:hypothetical protein
VWGLAGTNQIFPKYRRISDQNAHHRRHWRHRRRRRWNPPFITTREAAKTTFACFVILDCNQLRLNFSLWQDKMEMGSWQRMRRLSKIFTASAPRKSSKLISIVPPFLLLCFCV